MPDSNTRRWRVLLAAIVLLALPALCVHAWMAWTFPSYRLGPFAQDTVFAFAWCGLLLLVARRRLLQVASIPLAWLAYFGWLFLVLGEGVSYYLQADTFNARFFASLDVDNLTTGLAAFPWLIGGGLTVMALMALACVLLLAYLRRDGQRYGVAWCSKPVVVVLVILLLTACGVDSAPRRVASYLVGVQQSTRFAGTAQGQAVADQLSLNPIPPRQIVAAPGKNLVFLYLESLERIYWDPKVFPGLTPELDRLRTQGLDFSGFQTFAGATFTIAGMFASQCGVPYLPSPVHALDLGGNNANATSFQPGLTCLGDVLHKAGYTQIYLGGAPVQFSNKGLFYRLHGYNEALGLHELEAQAHHQLAESGWGLYDSELLPLALAEYRKLAAAGKPFNLSMITLDTHPPYGRPSPGCPKYRASANSMLQAVHCTDYLVGKFIARLKQQPGWNNTVVVIMSDHLMMRNDAEPLYPPNYHRQPALLVLNAGQGVRPVRMYHMDVAPTLLDFMHVRTNATFIAGKSKAAAKVGDSRLVNSSEDVAVLRKVLWSRAQPLQLCQGDVLVGQAAHGLRLGGHPVSLSWRGRREVGLWPHGAWVISVTPHSVNGAVLTNANGNPLDGGGVAARLARRSAGESALVIEPRSGSNVLKQFSVDWIGRNGGRTHIADVPTLHGLAIGAPKCKSLLARMNALPAGQTLDLSAQFEATTAPLHPPLASGQTIRFDQQAAVPFERAVGWLRPEVWGSFTVGNYATLGLTLPKQHCHAMGFAFKVHPSINVARPALEVGVYANGARMATWRFDQRDTAETWHRVFATVRTSDPECRVDLRFVFNRPGATPPPYPQGVDWRPLQLLFLQMHPGVPPLNVTSAH